MKWVPLDIIHTCNSESVGRSGNELIKKRLIDFGDQLRGAINTDENNLFIYKLFRYNYDDA